MNNPSNCKAGTKNKGYQEKMFFDWKIQLEKVQLTRTIMTQKITQYFTKESDSLAKMTKDIAILKLAHKQPLYGFPEKPVQFFK